MAIQPINIGQAPNDGNGMTLRDAFERVNSNYALIQAELDSKSPIGHTHPISDIVGLQAILTSMQDDITIIEGIIASLPSELEGVQESIVAINEAITAMNALIASQNVTIQSILTDLDYIMDQLDIIISEDIPEAPLDGQQYGRQDGEWTVIETPEVVTPTLQEVMEAGNTTTTGINILGGAGINIPAANIHMGFDNKIKFGDSGGVEFGLEYGNYTRLTANKVMEYTGPAISSFTGRQLPDASYVQSLVSGNTSVINVEKYRDNSKDESIWLQELIDNSKEGSTFIFESDKVYELNNSLTPKLNQTFVGNGATLRRANESKTTLSIDLLSSSNLLTVSSVPSDWKIGDKIHVYTGNAFNQTSLYNEITEISGNIVTLSSAIGGYTNASGTEITYSVGSGVRKVFDLFSGVQYPVAIPYKIKDFIFDGNYLNNTANYYWYFNANIGNYGYGGEVTGCFFKDIPNENIVCSGILVSDNFAQDINGSFVHFSSPPINLGENIQGTIVRDNRAFRTNKTSPALTDHSFSVLENSWNPGKIIVTGNYFEGVNNGSFCNNFIIPDFGTTLLTNEVSITGNIFKNYSKICQPLTHELLDPYNQKSRLITNNIFIDCGTNDFNLLKTTSIRFHNNLYEGNTTVTNNNQVLKERLGVEGLIVDNPNEPFSVQIGGLNQDNNILLGTAEGKATIQGYNKLTQSFSTNLHAQPYGGNFVIGSLFGNGSKFYVNGTGYFEASLDVNGNVKANNFITNNATASNHALPLGQAQTLLDLKVDKLGGFKSDINEDMDTGFYYVYNTSTGVPAGLQSGVNVLQHIQTEPIYSASQIIYSRTEVIYTRVKREGLWSDWTVLAKDADVVHKTGAETITGVKTLGPTGSLRFGEYSEISNEMIYLQRSDSTRYGEVSVDLNFISLGAQNDDGYYSDLNLRGDGGAVTSYNEGGYKSARLNFPYVSEDESYEVSFQKKAGIVALTSDLNLKANDSDVVHKTGNIAETVTGEKTFEGKVKVVGDLEIADFYSFSLGTGFYAFYAPSLDRFSFRRNQDAETVFEIIESTNDFVFYNSPFVPNATAPNHAVNKGQLDSAIAEVSGGGTIQNVLAESPVQVTSNWYGSQAQYDALGVYNDNVMYFIV